MSRTKTGLSLAAAAFLAALIVGCGTAPAGTESAADLAYGDEAAPLVVAMAPGHKFIDTLQAIDFTAEVEGGTPPYQLAWQKSGATFFGATVRFAFEAPRTEEVRLTVTDAAGASASVTHTLEVVDPLVVLAGAADIDIAAGQFVRFAARAAGGVGPFRFAWDFGDGQESAIEEPIHRYDRDGEATARLTVQDSRGFFRTVEIPISVRDDSGGYRVALAVSGERPEDVRVALPQATESMPAVGGDLFRIDSPFAPRPAVQVFIDRGHFGEEVMELSTAPIP